MTEYIMPFVHLTLEMAPYLLLGFLFAGLMHGFIPRRLYGKYLSKRNWRSALTAAAVGVPLPLCSCGVIPTAMSLRRNGASKGATVSFLIATPQTGVDSILATWSLMGLPFALLRPVAALVTAVFGGIMVNSLDKDAAGNAMADSEDERPVGFIPRLKASLEYGYVFMMQDIGKWLVVGLIIAGLITVFVPDNFFAILGGSSLLNMLLVLLIAAPMYVCATGSIPIAVALMMKGLTPGAALVFLMAGPATSMASIMVVNKVLHRRAMILYLASILCGAIGFGLIADTMMPVEWFTSNIAANCCMSHDIELWKVAAAALLAALLVNAFIRKTHHHDHCDCHNEAKDHCDNPKLKTQNSKLKTYKVDGMHCNHCRLNTEKAIASVPGVESVDVSLEEKIATVKGDIEAALVCKAVEELGFICTPLQ